VLCEHREDVIFCVGSFLGLIAGVVVVVDVIGINLAVNVEGLYGA
jgi:hypothetical protein